MKRFMVPVLVFACALLKAQNTPSYIQSTSTGLSGSSSTITLSGIVAGHALYIAVADGNGSSETITFTDSMGATWTTPSFSLQTAANLAVDADTLAVGCAIAPSSGTDTVTVLVNGTAPLYNNVAVLYEYANSTCTLDGSAVSSNTLNPTVCTSGPLTTATSNDLLFGFCDAVSNGTFSPGSGWLEGATAGESGKQFVLGETQLGSTIGNYTATSSTLTTASEQGTIEIAFKATTSGGGSGGGASITGGGTANTVPMFTGASTVGNSPISVSGSFVGIGTTNPAFQLQVGNFFGVTSEGAGSVVVLPTGNYVRFATLMQEIMRLQSNGYVGIGTTVPGQKLDVEGGGIQSASGGGGGSVITIGDNDPYASYPTANFGTLLFKSHYSTRNTAEIYLIGNNGTYTGDLRFAVDPNTGTPVDRMAITSAGNVGIGTTSPAYNLDVAGVVRAQAGIVFPDGNKQITAWTGVLCGGDYAEAMNAAGGKKNYEAGEVLVLTSGEDSDVEKSREPYSTMVAGIYATKPGVVGRRATLEKSTEDIPMAMVGVVPTKVTTENGAIHKGDLLVTSSTPGYAMKGTDRTKMLGAVIGKAMGSLDAGTGLIEVLVTLQ